MNQELERLVDEAGLRQAERWRERVRLGLALVARVEHLLEQPAVLAVLQQARDWSARGGPREELDALAARAAQLATSHQGSPSLDGTSHAAVSATHAVARAIQGRAIEAADYAAYAAVYAYGVSGVTSPDAYVDEHAAQVRLAGPVLRALRTTATPG